MTVATGNPLLDLMLTQVQGSVPSYPDLTLAGGYGLLNPTIDLGRILADYRMGRANLAQSAGQNAWARSMQLASRAADPYDPIGYLESMAQTGTPIPLLGRKMVTLKPIIPTPPPTPADQYVNDFLQYPETEPPDIARVRAAYAEDPARATKFFGRPSPFADGGTMMMRHPGVVVDAVTRRPIATLAENGMEKLSDEGNGMRVTPQPGVSRRLGRGRQQQIVDMALGTDGKYGMEDMPGMEGMAGGGNWIAGAVKNKGALHRQLGVPEGEKIPADMLEHAAHAGGKLGRRARLAQTLKAFAGGGGFYPQRRSPLLGRTGGRYNTQPRFAARQQDTTMPTSLRPQPEQPIVTPESPMPTKGNPAEGTPLMPLDTQQPAMRQMLNRPLMGSMAQKLALKNPAAARALQGKPMSAALIQYILGPAGPNDPVPGYTPVAGAAGGLRFDASSWGSELARVTKNPAADAAAHRAAAERETTTWAGVGPPGSAERRRQQDLNAAENADRWGTIAAANQRRASRPNPVDPATGLGRYNRPGAGDTANPAFNGATPGAAPSPSSAPGSSQSGDNSQQFLAKEVAKALATVEGAPLELVNTFSRGEIAPVGMFTPTLWARLNPRLRAILTGLWQSTGQGSSEDVASAMEQQTPSSYF